MPDRKLIAIALWGVSIGFILAGVLSAVSGWESFIPIGVLLLVTGFGLWATGDR